MREKKAKQNDLGSILDFSFSKILLTWIFTSNSRLGIDERKLRTSMVFPLIEQAVRMKLYT